MYIDFLIIYTYYINIMSRETEKNCRLCLNMLDDDYNVTEEITREIFEVLLLKVDLSVSEEPLVCKSCMKNVYEAFDFKSTCFSVDEQVVSLAIDRNSVELDIRDVYLIENKDKNFALHEDYNVCRFCLQCLEKCNLNLLNDLRGDVVDEMILQCIPELDLNIVKEPVVCAACIKSLESYYCFTMKCQNTEENIMKYCEMQRVQCIGQISLSGVLKYLFKSMPDCSKATALKGAYFDINNVLKIEKELIIKDENVFRAKENRCGETKRKKIVKYDKLPCNDSSEKHMVIYKDKANVIIYKCMLCSHETKWRGSLRTHMLIHKDSSDVVMYRCEKCAFKTKRKHYLKIHMLIHKDNSEVTMYKCNVCSYEAKWKSYLRGHMLKHKDSSDVVMYKCESCTYETKSKKDLKRHVLIHKDNSEVIMHKCNLCSLETRYKSSLRNHMLTHTSSDVIMYKCNGCTFETKHKGSIRLHMLTHRNNTQVTMYKCNLCSYESKWKSGLKYHTLTHKDSSEIVTYRCERCRFKTKYKYYLKRHMQNHHSGMM